MPSATPTVLASGSFLRLMRVGTWEYVQRSNASAVVAIAALTREREVVLVEQYRPPLARRTIELPAGLVGDDPTQAHEDPLAAAQRELEEETGFHAEHLRLGLHGPSSAGLTSETIHFFVAEDVVRRSPGGGVAGEDITVHVVSLATIDEWLRDSGLLIDPKIYTGLYLLLHRR